MGRDLFFFTSHSVFISFFILPDLLLGFSPAFSFPFSSFFIVVLLFSLQVTVIKFWNFLFLIGYQHQNLLLRFLIFCSFGIIHLSQSCIIFYLGDFLEVVFCTSLHLGVVALSSSFKC